MKRSFFILLMCCSSILYAQKPVKGEKGFTFGVNGLSTITLNTAPGNTGTLVFKYLVMDDVAARAGVTFGQSNVTTKSDTEGTGTQATIINKTSSWALSLGATKSFGKNAKLDPYAGADFWFGGTDGSMDSTAEVKSTKGGTVGDKVNITRMNIGSGSTFGLKGVVGFNYFFTDHFAFGGEFGYGFASTSGKNGTTTTTYTGTTFGTPGSTSTTNSATTSTSGFSPIGNGVISVSVFF